jgi:hypothetical protein
MKSRIQLAGVPHGSQDKVIWKGDLPQVSGIPGMRLVLMDHEKEAVNAYGFKQMCLEINTANGEVEQVIYVTNVDRSAKELVE